MLTALGKNRITITVFTVAEMITKNKHTVDNDFDDDNFNDDDDDDDKHTKRYKFCFFY